MSCHTFNVCKTTTENLRKFVKWGGRRGGAEKVHINKKQEEYDCISWWNYQSWYLSPSYL